MKRISKCQSWRLLKRYWASRPTPDEWMQLIRLLSTIKCAKMTPAEWRCCGPHSNLANNLFASACDSRRPIISFATFHLRSSSLPSAPPLEGLRDYSFDQSVMLLSRIGAMSERVKMSKFLLTVCAFGLLLSFAFAEEKSPEQHREESNQMLGVEGIQKMELTRVVASGTNQRIYFFYAAPIAPPAISISVLPSDRNMAQSRPRLQPTSPTSERKTSATGAIDIRFEASKLITSQPKNTSAAIHSSYSFSSPAASLGKFVST